MGKREAEVSAPDRLAAINAAREKEKLAHPALVDFLEQAKRDFPIGLGHFYPRGPRPERGINMEQAALSMSWEAMLRKRRQKELVVRKMKERNIK